MTDTRFTTEYDDLAAMLAGVDVDRVDDLDTLLAMLFVGWTVSVTSSMTIDDALDVTVQREGLPTIGCVVEFPASVLDLVDAAESAFEDQESVSENGPDEDASHPGLLPRRQLLAALVAALGEVRIYNLLYPAGPDVDAGSDP